MEESLPVKTIGDGPPAEPPEAETMLGGPGGESTALARDGGTGGLISILKGLEIEKSLATDPVVVALRYYPATSGSFAPLPPDLAPKLVEYLRGRGLDQLYTHQRAAYDLAKAGKSFVVTTPTASGKTLC
jgi:DEAD/DEAH box helicase domain-containing protein